MKLSIFCQFGLKTPIHAPKVGFWGISPRNWGEISTKPPKGTSPGRIGSSGVLIMSVSSIVPEKSRGNKQCDKEEKEVKRHIFGLFGIAVIWPRHGCVQLFWYLYVHSVDDANIWSILLFFRFFLLSFFWGCQKSALIPILKTFW